MHIHPQQPRGLSVLGAGAHRLAHLGLLDKKIESHHQDERRANDEHLHIRDTEGPELQIVFLELIEHRDRKAALLRTEELHRGLLQRKGHGDGGDQGRDMQLLAPQRAKGNELNDDTDDARAEHRHDEHHPDRQYPYLRHGGEHQREPDVRADHRDFPMRQMQQIEHPENQRIADGDQGIAAS